MNSRRHTLKHWGRTAVGVGALGHLPSFAAQFLDLPQACALLLPQAQSWLPQPVLLDAARLKALAERTQGPVPRSFAPLCVAGLRDGQAVGWVWTDQVVGKLDRIDYAAGFDARGQITGIEILAYRESHGAEIRQAAWRRQFAGRSGPEQVRWGDDIRNISGATLSCQHVTEGVRRLSALALDRARGGL